MGHQILLFLSIGLAKRMPKAPTICCNDMAKQRKGIIIESPTVISNDEDPLIYSDAAFEASDGKTAFDYIMVLKGVILNTDAYQGIKVTSSKEAKTKG